nr:MAG TPA_asm: hypothetical protein [Caudoviricetes sp.]
MIKKCTFFFTLFYVSYKIQSKNKKICSIQKVKRREEWHSHS